MLAANASHWPLHALQDSQNGIDGQVIDENLIPLVIVCGHMAGSSVIGHRGRVLMDRSSWAPPSIRSAPA